MHSIVRLFYQILIFIHERYKRIINIFSNIYTKYMNIPMDILNFAMIILLSINLYLSYMVIKEHNTFSPFIQSIHKFFIIYDIDNEVAKKPLELELNDSIMEKKLLEKFHRHNAEILMNIRNDITSSDKIKLISNHLDIEHITILEQKKLQKLNIKLKFICEYMQLLMIVEYFTKNNYAIESIQVNKYNKNKVIVNIALSVLGYQKI